MRDEYKAQKRQLEGAENQFNKQEASSGNQRAVEYQGNLPSQAVQDKIEQTVRKNTRDAPSQQRPGQQSKNWQGRPPQQR